MLRGNRRQCPPRGLPTPESEGLSGHADTRGLLTEKQGKFLFFVWLILLLPWMVVADLMAMVYDKPPTLSVYIGTFSIWTYPLSVGIVWMFRKKNPWWPYFPA